MSPLAALLATSFFFSSFVAAQINASPCNGAIHWTFNSLNQGPCVIAAYLLSTCNGSTYTLPPLPNNGLPYMGPTGVNGTILCNCNTVIYSLISACDLCQGETWLSWSTYSTGCIEVLPPSSFPNPVPADTRVPQWALIDVTLENTWVESMAFAAGDSPEVGPGKMIGPYDISVSASGTSSGSSSTARPTSKHTSSNSNTGLIVGCVVGGMVVISLAVAFGFFLGRHRREAPVVASLVAGASQPPMDEIQQPLRIDDGNPASSIPGTIGTSSMPETPAGPTRIYVRVSCPISPRTSMCAHHIHCFTFLHTGLE